MYNTRNIEWICLCSRSRWRIVDSFLLNGQSNLRSGCLAAASEGYDRCTNRTLVGINSKLHVSSVSRIRCHSRNSTLGNSRCLVANPAAIIRNSRHQIALEGQLHSEVATFLLDFCSSFWLYNLHDRLLNLNNRNINQLNSTIVSGLRTFNGHYVTYLNAKAKEVLRASVLIKRTINIYLACSIIQVPVTISGVGNRRNGTLYTIGLTIGTINNLLTGSNFYSLYTLSDIDFLYQTATNQLNSSSSCRNSGASRNNNLCLTSTTRRRSNGQPIGHILEFPVCSSIHHKIRRTAIL